MSKLKIDTKNSLYEPVEVEINGKTFQVKKITREIGQQLADFDAQIQKGNTDAIYQRLELVIGKNKEIDQLGIHEAITIMKFIIHKAFSPEKIEKKVQGPGQEK